MISRGPHRPLYPRQLPLRMPRFNLERETWLTILKRPCHSVTTRAAEDFQRWVSEQRRAWPVRLLLALGPRGFGDRREPHTSGRDWMSKAILAGGRHFPISPSFARQLRVEVGLNPRIARSSLLTLEARRQLAWWTVEMLDAHEEDLWEQRSDLFRKLSDELPETLAVLSREEEGVPPAVLEALLERTRPMERDLWNEVPKSAEENTTRLAAEMLTAVRHLPEALACELHDRLRPCPVLLERLARRASGLPVERILEILDGGDGRLSSVEWVVDARPALLEDARIRERLRGSTEPKILRHLLSHGSPEERSDHFQALARTRPEVALEVLEENAHGILGALDPAALLPLLVHSDPEIRLRSVSLSHRVLHREVPRDARPSPAPAPVEAPAPSPSRSR